MAWPLRSRAYSDPKDLGARAAGAARWQTAQAMGPHRAAGRLAFTRERLMHALHKSARFPLFVIPVKKTGIQVLCPGFRVSPAIEPGGFAAAPTGARFTVRRQKREVSAMSNGGELT